MTLSAQSNLRGTTITLDQANTVLLPSDNAASEDQPYYGYLRHAQAPIQIITSNTPGMNANRSGVFGIIHNDMKYEDGSIACYNNAEKARSTIQMAIIAPKGYNITRYQLTLNSSQIADATDVTAGTPAGGTFEEITCENNELQTSNVINSVTLDGTDNQTMDVVKTSSGNRALYFRITFPGTSQYKLILKSFKITYTVDEPFTEHFPGGVESYPLAFHSGLLDLGTFTQNNFNVWSFQKSAIHDRLDITACQEVTAEGGKPTYQNLTTTTVDGTMYFQVSANGTYYLECPSKHRITGASLNFSTQDEATYTVIPYDATGTIEGAPLTLGTGQTTATAQFTGFNNDAVKFTVSGLAEGATALFTADLQMNVLDPHLQAITLAYPSDDSEEEVGNITVTSENYAFTDANVVISAMYAGNHTNDPNYLYHIVAREAFNENRTAAYTGTPSGNGLSNYFLIKDPKDVYYMNLSAKYNANWLGTQKVAFSNIETLTKGSGTLSTTETQRTLTETDETAIRAGAAFQEIKLKNNESKEIYIYSADKPVNNIKAETNHVAYRFYSVNVKPIVEAEVAQIELVPIYQSTLKGRNNKTVLYADDLHTAQQDPTVREKDSDVDNNHTFFGVKVTSNGAGYLNTNQIYQALDIALGEEHNKENSSFNFYNGLDIYRGILYMDMSALKSVSDDGFLDMLHKYTADNCLYFMPSGFNRQGIMNTVTPDPETGEMEAIGHIVLTDQQPFFTPYDFKTGVSSAIYKRTRTNDKETVMQASVVLPFEIPLDDEGHLRVASDETNEKLTFYDMAGFGTEQKYTEDGDPITYNTSLCVSPVTTGKAEANRPYHVVSAMNDEDTSFEISLTNAQFKTTETPTGLTGTHPACIAHGSYNGCAPTKADNLFYFAQNMFWKSGALTQYNNVLVLPFRAYFEFSDATGATMNNVLSVSFDEPDHTPTTGLCSIAGNEQPALRIATGKGTMTVTATTDTALSVVSLSGRKVAAATLRNGEARSFSLGSGIYLVNGTKVVVK